MRCNRFRLNPVHFSVIFVSLLAVSCPAPAMFVKKATLAVSVSQSQLLSLSVSRIYKSQTPSSFVEHCENASKIIQTKRGRLTSPPHSFRYLENVLRPSHEDGGNQRIFTKVEGPQSGATQGWIFPV